MQRFDGVPPQLNIPENDLKKPVEVYVDFDKSLSLFHMNSLIISFINQRIPKIIFDELVVLPSTITNLNSPTKNCIYLFLQEEEIDKKKEVYIKWMEKGVFKEKIITVDQLEKVLENKILTTKEKIIVRLNENPKAIHKVRELCDILPVEGVQEISRIEGEELRKEIKENIKNGSKVVDYVNLNNEAITIWDYLQNGKDPQTNLPFLTLAEEIKSHWNTIFTTLREKKYPISVLTFNEFPEVVKLIMEEILGITGIHVEAGGGKTKLKKIQHLHALAAQIIFKKEALPDQLKENYIYLTLIDGVVKAYWLSEDNVELSQVIKVPHDKLQSLADNTLINKETDSDLLLEIAPLCHCISSLERAVYADDDSDPFLDIKNFGGTTIHLPASLKNAQTMADQLPRAIQEAKEKKVEAKQVKRHIRSVEEKVPEDFFTQLSADLDKLVMELDNLDFYSKDLSEIGDELENNEHTPDLANRSLTLMENAYKKFLQNETKFYDLELMFFLERTNILKKTVYLDKGKALSGKIYISNDGTYIIRVSEQEVAEGKMDDPIFNKQDLKKLQQDKEFQSKVVEDQEFKSKILEYFSKAGYETNKNNSFIKIFKKRIAALDAQFPRVGIKNSKKFPIFSDLLSSADKSTEIDSRQQESKAIISPTDEKQIQPELKLIALVEQEFYPKSKKCLAKIGPTSEQKMIEKVLEEPAEEQALSEKPKQATGNILEGKIEYHVLFFAQSIKYKIHIDSLTEKKRLNSSDIFEGISKKILK